MSKFICNNGHINSTSHPNHDWKGMKCMECGEKLQTSPAIEALCARYEARTFKVVECVFEKDQAIQVEYGEVAKGPIEGVLLVVMPHDQLRNLADVDGLWRFTKGVVETIKDAGWEGEVMVISETMKFARFEVEEL